MSKQIAKRPSITSAPCKRINSARELARIFQQEGETFSSLTAMRKWLEAQGIDCAAADNVKGLDILFGKVRKKEARLVFAGKSGQVLRLARTARLDVEVTIHGQRYPLFEFCQIFLDKPTTPAILASPDEKNATRSVGNLAFRTAHVRDSQQLWETLTPDEDPLKGARRCLREELGLSAREAGLAGLTMARPVLEFEHPIEWPGIPTILETHPGRVVLPEEISKPVYVELEKGNQITVFVATPNTPVMKLLLRQIIPDIVYCPQAKGGCPIVR